MSSVAGAAGGGATMATLAAGSLRGAAGVGTVGAAAATGGTSIGGASTTGGTATSVILTTRGAAGVSTRDSVPAGADGEAATVAAGRFVRVLSTAGSAFAGSA